MSESLMSLMVALLSRVTRGICSLSLILKWDESNSLTVASLSRATRKNESLTAAL